MFLRLATLGLLGLAAVRLLGVAAMMFLRLALVMFLVFVAVMLFGLTVMFLVLAAMMFFRLAAVGLIVLVVVEGQRAVLAGLFAHGHRVAEAKVRALLLLAALEHESASLPTVSTQSWKGGKRE
jgi:hypothetical protein